MESRSGGNSQITSSSIAEPSCRHKIIRPSDKNATLLVSQNQSSMFELQTSHQRFHLPIPQNKGETNSHLLAPFHFQLEYLRQRFTQCHKVDSQSANGFDISDRGAWNAGAGLVKLPILVDRVANDKRVENDDEDWPCDCHTQSDPVEAQPYDTGARVHWKDAAIKRQGRKSYQCEINGS